MKTTSDEMKTVMLPADCVEVLKLRKKRLGIGIRQQIVMLIEGTYPKEKEGSA